MRIPRAVLIAGHRPWRSAAVAAFVSGAIAIPWHRFAIPAAAPPPAPAAPTYRYVPLSGDSLDTLAPDQCVPFADELLSHPHWQLQIGDAWWSCTDRGYERVFTITDGENLAWDERGIPPRRLALTDAERATLRSFTRLSCATPDDEDEHRHDDRTFIVSIGDLHSGRAEYPEMDGPRIVGRSPMGRALDGVFTAAIHRYVDQRLTWLGDLRLELDAPPYRAVLHGDILSMWRGRRFLSAQQLDARALVDLGDWALALPPTGMPRTDYETVRGWILVDGRRVPLALPRMSAFGTPLDLVARALDDAMYEDAR